MKNYTAILVLAIGFISFNSQAQIKLNNLGVGVSYWERSYSSVDERAFLRNYPGEGNFNKGGAIPFVSAEVGLWRNIALDARIGVWNGTFESREAFGNSLEIAESIEQTIIPVSVGLLLRKSDWFANNFDVFAGLGLNRYFIQNKVSREVAGGSGSVSPETFSGNNYGFNFKAGVEYYFTNAIGLALEGRYNTGNYNQQHQAVPEAPVQNYEVSLKGPEIGISLKYRFKAASAEESEPVMDNVE